METILIIGFTGIGIALIVVIGIAIEVAIQKRMKKKENR